VLAGLLAVTGLAALGAPKAAAGAGGQDDGRFFFVQLTDTHWGARDGVNLTRLAVERIRTLPVPVAFVVHTGDVFADVIEKPEVVKAGLEAMKGLSAPVYYVPGNHDILKGRTGKTAGQFKQAFGPLNREVVVEGVRCLFLCTEMMDEAAGFPGQIQRDWLESRLGRKGEKGAAVLIFMHRPPIRDVLGVADEGYGDPEGMTQWERFMARHPEVMAVIGGHLHRDELQYIGDVPIHVAAGLARFWDRQPSFRLYEYDRGRLSYCTLYLERYAGGMRWTGEARPDVKRTRPGKE
jgi:predicted phosphodiesterase